MLAVKVDLAKGWGWSDGVGLIVAGLLLFLGLVMLAASFNRRAAGATLDPGDLRPAGRNNPHRTPEGLVLMLSGLALLRVERVVP